MLKALGRALRFAASCHRSVEDAMKRSLLASALALAFGFSTQVGANPTNTLTGDAS
jgi:hypothetical protein